MNRDDGELREKPTDSVLRRNSYSIETNKLLEAYRTMLLSRKFDERCTEMLSQGKAVPHFHSGVGQEALMIGSILPLRADDAMIYTHRGYGQLMAKGVSVEEIALDTFMKVGGTNNGLGGNMHVSRPDLGIYGREGVFGTRFGLAAGLALASKLKGQDSVTLCSYGEAAGARGILYESLNMAVLWKLPIVFLAENNGYSFMSRTEWLYPESRMSRVWRGFNIPVHEFDGNDLLATFDTVSEAVAHARSGAGPVVLEGLTYRIDPHIWFDAAKYQPDREIEEWRSKDPIERTLRQLSDRGVPDADVAAIGLDVTGEIDRAFEAAEAAPFATWSDNVSVTAQ